MRHHAKPTPGHPHAMMFILFIVGLGLGYVFLSNVIFSARQTELASRSSQSSSTYTNVGTNTTVHTSVNIFQPTVTSVTIAE